MISIHHRDIDPFDIHRGQRRGWIKSARPCGPEMGMESAAAPLKIPSRFYRSPRSGECRDYLALDFYAGDHIGIALSSGFAVNVSCSGPKKRGGRAR
jgi:hypothetical protein